jgi:hypothetical protein
MSREEVAAGRELFDTHGHMRYSGTTLSVIVKPKSLLP